MSDLTSTVKMVLERDFAAPPERVYRAFIEPDQLAQWFGPLGFHIPLATVRINARTGGFWHLIMVNNNNSAITAPVDSIFTEVTENVRLVSYEDTRGMPGIPDGTRLVLSIEFLAVGEGTRVRVEQGPFPRDLSQAGAGGWRQSFHKLDALLESSEPALE